MMICPNTNKPCENTGCNSHAQACQPSIRFIEPYSDKEKELMFDVKIETKPVEQLLNEAYNTGINQAIDLIDNYYLDHPDIWHTGHFDIIVTKLRDLKK